MPKSATRLTETIHIDEFMDFKRNATKSIEDLERGIRDSCMEDKRDIEKQIGVLKVRLSTVEGNHIQLEETMQDLRDSLSTLKNAILGDLAKPDQPGMAENVRTLVTLHRDESRVKKTLMRDISWKAITVALGAITGLIAIIWKLIPFVEKIADK